jgi:dihydroxyacetone kinase-like protein
MKKIINNPKNVVPEMIEGYLGVYGDIIEQVENYTSVVRKNLSPNKVGLIIGGGSGHEPLFMDYIGLGYAAGVAQGNIFAAPSPDNILAVTKAVDRGKGLIYVFGNYAGDILNFEMAAELAEFEGIKTASVPVTDDVASAPKDRIKDRRGIAGDLFVMRLAGAACEAGLELDEVTRVTEKANANTRTMGVALSPGTIPGEQKAAFTLAEDEMEIGMGLHGEPGVRRGKLQTADEIVDQMMEIILADLPFTKGDDVCVLVNGLGSTSRLELMLVARRVRQVLAEARMQVYDFIVGNFAVCQEMAGCSVTLMRLDEELKSLYDTPCWTMLFGARGRTVS